MTKKIKKSNVVVVHKYPEAAEWFGDIYLRISAFIAANRWVFWAGVALLCLAALYSFPTKGADDYDVWFHLEYGKLMVKNFTWDIDHAQFSWTPSDPGWKYVSWLAEWIFYLLYSAGSMYALYALQWALCLTIIALYYHYVVKSLNSRFDIYCLMELVLMIVVLALSYPYIKPEMFSVFYFAITVFIYFITKLSSRKLYWFYPLLFLLWVNTHGAFFMGLFFLGFAVTAEAFSYLFYKKVSMSKERLIEFALASAFSCGAVLINPQGIHYITSSIRALFAPEYGGQVHNVVAYFSLWGYLFPKEFVFRFINTAWCLVFMVAIFSAASWYAFRRTKEIDVPVLLLNGVFFFISMQAARTSYFYPLLFIFSVHYTLRRVDLAEIKKRVSPVALGLLLYLSLYTVYIGVAYQDAQAWFGYKYQDVIPIKEVEYIKKNKLPGPIFNDYLIGGYMMWSMYPQYKVFIDPRFGPYVKDVFPDWIRVLNDTTPATLKWFLSKYHFRTALLDVKYAGIVNWLLRDPEWRLVYFDKVAFVIVNQSVLPALSHEALMTDVSPGRFRYVTSPLKLVNLFDFYINIGPAYGREIMAYYYKNVSKFYINRDTDLQAMGKVIMQKVSQIQQQQKQQQQLQQQQNQKNDGKK